MIQIDDEEKIVKSQKITDILERNFIFYRGFLSRTFMIHMTAGEGGSYLFNFSLPLPPTSQTLH